MRLLRKCVFSWVALMAILSIFPTARAQPSATGPNYATNPVNGRNYGTGGGVGGGSSNGYVSGSACAAISASGAADESCTLGVELPNPAYILCSVHRGEGTGLSFRVTDNDSDSYSQDATQNMATQGDTEAVFHASVTSLTHSPPMITVAQSIVARRRGSPPRPLPRYRASINIILSIRRGRAAEESVGQVSTAESSVGFGPPPITNQWTSTASDISWLASGTGRLRSSILRMGDHCTQSAD
jgi:hypothetical protein